MTSGGVRQPVALCGWRLPAISPSIMNQHKGTPTKMKLTTLMTTAVLAATATTAPALAGQVALQVKALATECITLDASTVMEFAPTCSPESKDKALALFLMIGGLLSNIDPQERMADTLATCLTDPRGVTECLNSATAEVSWFSVGMDTWTNHQALLFGGCALDHLKTTTLFDVHDTKTCWESGGVY